MFIYLLQLCWVSNTYYVPMDRVIPIDDGVKRNGEITYYQWVPFILLFMALLFKLPRIVWKVLTSTKAIDLQKVIYMRAHVY